MTHKVLVFKLLVLTVVAIALAIMISPRTVRHFVPSDQARVNRSAASQIADLPNLQLSRVRLLVSTMR